MLISIISYVWVVVQVMNLKKRIKNLKWFLYSNTLLENLPDMVLFLNYDGHILWGNKIAHEKLKLLNDVTINEVIKSGMRSIRDSIKQNKSVLVQTVIHGAETNVELSASRSGKKFFVCLKDNTMYINDKMHRKTQDKFNTEKNAFISDIRKEIVSPIASVSGFSQGMLDGIAGELSEKQIKYLKIINSNAIELQEFLEKFADFSECESSIYKPAPNNFDIVIKIKNILKELQPQLKLKNIAFDFYYDAIQSRNIFFDENAFEKIILNIINTCVNIMSENGSITIHLAVPDEENSIACGLEENKKYMQIIIKQSGSGMSQDEIRYICNPYANAKNGRKYLLRSLCMGIASILIKRNRGFININSEVMNGTLYNIIIPVEKEENE